MRTKALISILFVSILTVTSLAQAPLSFKYQAVLRDKNGNVKVSASVSMVISILQGSTTGTVVYTEIHNATTDIFGVLNLDIGKGTVTSGTFSGINWSTGTYFIKLTVDGVEIVTTQLLSVPYALYATKAGNGFSGNYNDLTNTPTLSTVATTGNYNDLSSKPAFATVATSGKYADLSSKPTLAVVATSGDYADLSSRPVLRPVATSGSYKDLDDKPSLFDGKWSSLTDKPTTIAGYGITDAATKEYVDAIKEDLKLQIYAEMGVTDADGNSYKTVRIGSQIWMAENLKTTKYSDGSAITNVTDDNAWNVLTTEAYTWYNNNSTAYKGTYGALYNWFAVNTDKLCPSGWHVPTDGEWHILALTIDPGALLQGTESLSGGGKLKETGTTHWQSPNTGATNESGFTALPGGTREDNIPGGYNPSSNFEGLGIGACFWTSTEYNTNIAWYRNLGYNAPQLSRAAGTNQSKRFGYSVRCIKGEVKLPAITTTDVSSITSNSAIGGGNITSDGGSTVLTSGLCWSTSQNPTVSDNKTTNGSIIGTFASSITGLNGNTTYYIRAYAKNKIGTTYGNQVSFTTLSNIVTDADGNNYNFIQIGTQVWMTENLKTTKYNDGTSIPNITDNTAWNALSTPAYCWYNNDIANKTVYGALYNWYAVNTGKLCPVGWHVATDPEWHTLILFYDASATLPVNGWESTTAAKNLKEAGTLHWTSPNLADNSSGFTILPSGIRHIDISWSDLYNGTRIWSSTEYNATNVYNRGFYYNNTIVSRNINPKTNGFSVRCKKD